MASEGFARSEAVERSSGGLGGGQTLVMRSCSDSHVRASLYDGCVTPSSPP